MDKLQNVTGENNSGDVGKTLKDQVVNLSFAKVRNSGEGLRSPHPNLPPIRETENYAYAIFLSHPGKEQIALTEGAAHAALPPTKAKSAFTLAEVLITLGVIGVVAAITIPGLMTAHKKHITATKLERAVSVITQAIRLSENENGQMENWNKNLPYDEFINTYFRPFMTIMQICSESNTCGYTTLKTLQGLRAAYSNPFNGDRMGILTSDGIVYFYSKITGELTSANNDKMIIIDINGSEKPNTFGKDVFFFYRDEDADSVIPYGSNKTREEIKNDCSENGSGYYCATLIRENGWKIPSGYPKL